MIRLCEWCNTEFSPTAKGGRFCGRSCSAKWRCATGRQAKWAPERKANISQKVKAWHKQNPHIAEEASVRMTNKNPMLSSEARQKVSNTLKAMGHGPRVRGGNGTRMTVAEAALAHEFPEAVSEYVVRTAGMRGGNLPNHYKIDLAFPKVKLAVEVDGKSHGALSRKAQDRKKERALESAGWTVLRFKNEVVLGQLGDVKSTISQCLATLRIQ